MIRLEDGWMDENPNGHITPNEVGKSNTSTRQNMMDSYQWAGDIDSDDGNSKDL